MPHCIVEHSSFINASELNNKVFLGALESNLFEPDGKDIKVRSIAYEHYQTGSEREDFIHITVRILSGRTEEDKLKLSKAIMCQLESLQLVGMSLTVEIVDIERSSYSKRVV
ncbi:hypothetical protein V6R21_22015 [Limibacter armeniacum]|uniref:5-carboxymethyl-2-hydroxymuconate Delta-isomerase n=1 Tax=Limibacter armeniacum TaxID=466084 RepID=UPI002FE6C490